MPRIKQAALFDFSDTRSFPISKEADREIDELASKINPSELGAIYTREEVVNFILDLIGYVPENKLFEQRILEPAFGNGDFLIQIIDRLIESWRNHSKTQDVRELHKSVFAVEIHKGSVQEVQNKLVLRLMEFGFSEREARKLTSLWLSQGDFLLETPTMAFDFIAGNPPYIRQEMISSALLQEYRNRFQTFYDRADLYILFIEKSLKMLSEKGVLGFICSDRWMKNKYGGPLRKLIADQFHLQTYIDMVDTDAFLTEVTAYPAITVLSREKTSYTNVVIRPEIRKADFQAIINEISLPDNKQRLRVQRIENAINGADPWLLEQSPKISLLKRLERQYPALEATGCKVGIGVATGADKVFIGNNNLIDVEEDRKLPLLRTKDIRSGEINWQQDIVINPYDSTGGLVNLSEYPKLRKYFVQHRNVLEQRHCATKSPNNWYRTIDLIRPALTNQPKLLIPDIKGKSHIVYDEGQFYPHHNLYYITAKQWDLLALQAVLLSRIAQLFIEKYSTQIRGGYFRFQAQYLRKIRLPHWQDVPDDLKKDLIRAGRERDLKLCNDFAYKLYNLSDEEKSVFDDKESNNGH